jgi:tellurite resistance protein
MEQSSRLEHFSISFFSIVLGLSGLALVFVKLSELFHSLYVVSQILTGVGLVSFLLVAMIFGIRLLRYPKVVAKEFAHPIKMNFYPLISKIFLIQSVIFLSFQKQVSLTFWLIGVVIQTIFIFSLVSTWIGPKNFEIHHINPAWFMPVVGSIMIPIAGVEHGYRELSWFFFAIGFILWVVLFTIVMYRVIFHAPLAERLIPTLFILFAPPAIGFISYYKLTGSFDSFARVMFYFGIFLFILVVMQWRQFITIKFYLSWWAYSFPLAALTVSTILMYRVSKIYFYKSFAIGLAVVLSLVVLYLVFRTLQEIRNKSLCIEEKE